MACLASAFALITLCGVTAVPDIHSSECVDDINASVISQYRENGFVVLRDFWEPEDLREWQDAVMEAVSERRLEWKFPRQHQEDVTNIDREYYDQVFVQRINLWATNSRVKALFEKHGARIGRIASLLEGISGVRIWHDQALIKEGWANPTSFHADNPYWTFHSKHAISIWMALDNSTETNGGMLMLPGSHRIVQETADPFKLVHIGKNHGDYFTKHPAGSQLRQIEPHILEMAAGSVSFHNGLTVHGANPNNSPHQRRAMTCALMPDGSTFNGLDNVYTQEQMKRYQVGDLLRDDELNPLLWSEEHPTVSFPEGLPGLKYSGHHFDPIDQSILSPRQKAVATELGYI